MNQEFEDYYDAESAVKEMNDKKVEGFRLIVEPSGKKRYGSGNRSRSRSRDNKKKHSRRRRYPPKYMQFFVFQLLLVFFQELRFIIFRLWLILLCEPQGE